MSQVATKRCTIGSIMRGKSFVRGFNDVQKGLPLDPEAYRDKPADQWRYERGRQFGCIYRGKLKQGNAILHDAAYAYSEGLRSRAII